MAALAFVPLAEVTTKFELLLGNAFFVENENDLEEFLAYFEDTWIGRPRPNGQPRRAPHFTHKLWNCFDGTLSGLARTNNAVEAWHRGFSTVVAAHPKIFPFINELKREQLKNMFIIEQLIAGNVPPQSKKYHDTAKSIKTIVQDYANRGLTDYLRGLAHNFELQAHS